MTAGNSKNQTSNSRGTAVARASRGQAVTFRPLAPLADDELVELLAAVPDDVVADVALSAW